MTHSFRNEGVHVTGGTVNISGSAIGRGARVGAPDAFRGELAVLATDPKATPDDAAALRWLADHAADPEEPAEARDRVSALRAAGAWLWDRLTALVDASAPAVAGWLVVLVHNVARW